MAVERDPSEGLGLVVAITSGPYAAAWGALERVGEPALTTLGIFTMEYPRRSAVLAVDARSDAAFLDGWALMAGVARVGAERRIGDRREPLVGAAEPMSVANDDRRRVLDAAATIALALYSFVAALGFRRVFGDWEFVGDVLVVVIVGHGLSWLLRQQRRVHGAVAIGITAIVLVWVIAWLNYPTTFTSVFPTTETWNIARADLALVRDQFATAVSPVAYVGGWSLLAAIGTAIAVLLGDTFAFRARARGEALVPGGVLFIFVAAVGASQHRVALTLALVAAGVLAAALLRARFAQPPRTVLGRPRRPLGITLPAAIGVGAAVVIGAWVLGPRLPGAKADALIDTKGRGGGVTEVLNPLVDIRARLVDRAGTELFVVQANDPAYWRATGLPEFDGRTWSLPEQALDDVGGELSTARARIDRAAAADRDQGPQRRLSARGRRARDRPRGRRSAMGRGDLDVGPAGAGAAAR